MGERSISVSSIFVMAGVACLAGAGLSCGRQEPPRAEPRAPLSRVTPVRAEPRAPRSRAEPPPPEARGRDTDAARRRLLQQIGEAKRAALRADPAVLALQGEVKEARKRLADGIEQAPDVAAKKAEKDRLAADVERLQSQHVRLAAEIRDGRAAAGAVSELSALEEKIRAAQTAVATVYRDLMRVSQSAQETDPAAKSLLAAVREKERALETKLDTLPDVVDLQRQYGALREPDATNRDSDRSAESSPAATSAGAP